MFTKETFKETQPIAYQTIQNGFKNQKLSHAYLLSGSNASPLQEVATFIAESFVCDSPINDLACETCSSCLKIQHHTYYDLIFIDGDDASIKKEQMEQIQEEFAKTALEAKGKKIYIIHKIENASVGAINSLLKFLEEPTEDVLALLTTENLSKVLPTIISRCQLIRLKDLPKEEIIPKLLEEGYSQEDCFLLTNLYANYEEMKEQYTNQDYIQIKDLCIDTLSFCLQEDIHQVPYYVQREIYPVLENKERVATYFNILLITLKEVVRVQNHETTHLLDSQNIIEGLAKKFHHVEEKIKAIYLALGNLNVNANLALLVDSLFYQIQK